MTITAPGTTASTTYDLGPAAALSCRACGHRTALAAEFACPQCFGPLEIAYDFPKVTRESIERGPKSIWRYKDLLPVPSTVDQYPNWRLPVADGSGRPLVLEELLEHPGVRRLSALLAEGVGDGSGRSDTVSQTPLEP